jgi:hypothetical protein
MSPGSKSGLMHYRQCTHRQRTASHLAVLSAFRTGALCACLETAFWATSTLSVWRARGNLPKTRLLGNSWEGWFYLAPHLPPAKPSVIHAAMNSNNPKIQQNTPRVQIKLRYGPDGVCVRSQTSKAHVPAESINPKRLMEPAAYRNLLRLFCAINLLAVFGLKTSPPEAYTLKLLRVLTLALESPRSATQTLIDYQR